MHSSGSLYGIRASMTAASDLQRVMIAPQLPQVIRGANKQAKYQPQTMPMQAAATETVHHPCQNPCQNPKPTTPKTLICVLMLLQESLSADSPAKHRLNPYQHQILQPAANHLGNNSVQTCKQ
jgi:hypothetical protein